MEYKNTQVGTALLMIFGAVIALLIIVSYNKPNETIWPALFFLGLISLLFSTLNIEVDHKQVKWSFGPSFWRKAIAIEEIESARVINTKWYYGLGVRFISTGWLYNVSGLRAVEIKLKNGKRVSLGTNEPENLLKAINSQLAGQNALSTAKA
ncbi:hypothetical protein SG34_004565 [Thalassomonas viridans]|uniref:Uncharacterized protein n=1 Tax=Thalassomonas viridans TaxID=137584 RepID=A0AAF0C9V8_9GAMM|nr:hypothetical protein [Thalassomonas viridans]WDE06208.1 hypothetical protein SG34_004565 [Thalassomonas viridans]